MKVQRLIRKLISLALFILPTTLSAQVSPRMTDTEIQTKGSLPPITEWYSCTRNLQGKPLDRKEADRCLQSILAHPHLTAGKVVVKREGRHTLVSFILESPPLTLSKVDFGLSLDRELEFEDSIRRDEYALHTGDTYDALIETQTALKLREFLISKGVVALLSKDLALDYDRKTANLFYKIWEGPSTTEEHWPIPNGQKCEVYVKDVNLIDMDDYTPLPLVNTILAIRRTPCFSSEAIKKAKQELDNTNLFSSMEIRTADAGEWRNVTVSARTNPTKVGHILYKWYGSLSETRSTDLPSIPLAANQVYRRSEALASRDILLDFYSKPGFQVKVHEEVILEPDHLLTVVFHVLGAKTDTLSIDGKEIR